MTRKNEQSSGATRGDAARRWSYHVGRALRGATLSCLALGCDPEPPRRGPAPSVRLEPARASGAAAPSRSSHAPRAERDERASPSGLAAVSPSREPESTRRPPAAFSPGAEREPAAPRRSEPAPVTELEPGVNEEFDEDILLDLDEALAATDENAFALLFKKEQVWIDGELVKKEKTARPDNCRRWRYYRDRGYKPKNPLGKEIDAGALVRCGSLEFLKRARPSRVSHVRRLLVGAGPDAFPALVASAASPLVQQARDRAVQRGSTLAEFLPGARVIPSELPGRLSISEPTSDSSVILNAEAWGDINDDGIEDLALSVLNGADDGSSFVMRLLHVTRRSASAPLTVLAVVE